MSDAQPGGWSEALRGRSGREYWRGLDDLLDTPEFRDALEREFPAGAAELSDGMTRRSFFKLLGASMVLAGIGGCTRQPAEKILPYVRQPPELTPGIPLHYATSMVVGGYATGLLVESHAGRPTKVEGNPEHPASLGAAGVYEQASVLQLYDPHRARRLRSPAGTPASWGSFVQAFGPGALARRAGASGAGLHVLLEPTSSRLVAELISRARQRFPEASFHFFAPLASAAPLEGARTVFGRPLQPRFDFREAAVVLALDADFLGSMPFHLRYARDFAGRRRIGAPSDAMNRLYAVEGTFSVTGGIADHRLRVRTADVQHVAAAVLAEAARGLERQPEGMPAELPPALERRGAGVAPREWVQAVARDLRANAGRSIVIAGERQPPHVHAIAYLLNAALGNVGRTVWFTESPILEAGELTHGLAPLVEAMEAGQVGALLVLEGNPSYAAPADLEFARRLRAVPAAACLGLFENETARDCGWFVPAVHYLEAWGDARAYDGTASLIQPLVAPLYGGKTPAELLAVLVGHAGRSAHALVREAWLGGGTPRREDSWEQALQRGLVPGTALPAAPVVPRWEALFGALPALAPSGADPAPGLEVVFAQDPAVYDGRFANNAWLLELPDPLTKLTWDNAALLSPATAERLSVATGDVLELRYGDRALRIPAFVLPGHADGSVSLRFGYGRGGAEAVAAGVGVDVYRIWTSAAPYFDAGLTLERVLAGDGETPVRHPLATTQEHWAMEGRDIVRRATLERYRRNPSFTKEQRGPVLSLYEPFEETGEQWGMVVDLSLCTGCNACVVACQAENNVPVVGKEGVLASREMHWLRIDRYFTGEPEEAEVVTQPMLCQHCEKAPCEYVCPVNATVHSHDGLNEMIYNRCIGTRFCSNNCPYKVRRFNWFDYNEGRSETEEMVMNPDVTVRARGVMEKCTFCVQRIRGAEIGARLERRRLEPGEVRTACQQACPTGAIVFGSYTNPDGELVRRASEPRRYGVLHELGTRPRVQYLARITNPNPALREGA